jgi:peptidoglycan/LPS O-acetylase OafA/YrhL
VTSRGQSTLHPTPRLGNVLDLSAGLIAAGLLTLSYTGESGLPRVLLALGFAFFVPGRAMVANWPRMAIWSELAMSVVLSLALLTLLATVTLWAHVWNPMALFRVEAWLSLAGLCLASVRRNRHRPDQADRQPEPFSRRRP